MVKIRVLRAVLVDGEACGPGDVVEVSAGDARLLIGMGKAAAADEPTKAVTRRAVKIGSETAAESSGQWSVDSGPTGVGSEGGPTGVGSEGGPTGVGSEGDQ